MLPQNLYEGLKNLISQHFNTPVKTLYFEPVRGGSINQTFKLTFSNTHTLFCKINNAAAFPQLFLKERQGLEAIRKTGTVKTPNVVAYAILDTYQVLLLDWVERGENKGQFFKIFGEQLAALHQVKNASFGWETDNYMGSVPQQNDFNTEWNSFFIQHRLEPLVQQCLAKNLLTEKEHGRFKNLYARLPQIFDAGEKPTLLHGDLWSGNFMCNLTNEPVLIDPAVYYGHRYMDIAMTTLFGGFDKSFYESYHYYFPQLANHKEQVEICKLYPLLIHLLLFGKPYLTAIQQTIAVFR